MKIKAIIYQIVTIFKPQKTLGMFIATYIARNHSEKTVRRDYMTTQSSKVRGWLQFSIVLLLPTVVAIHFGGPAGCSGSTSTTSSTSGTTTCAKGSNDFYVVENASCVVNSGKLSRVNPDVPCKEEFLTGLDCPVDFVLSTVDTNIGYLSLRTNGTGAKPGEIYEVDLSQTTAALKKTQMNANFNKSFVSPAGLALIENLTQAERDVYCGGNTITSTVLMVADEGTADGGTVWIWCINTSDFDQNLTPIALISVTADGVENPRGVDFVDRDTVVVTAHTTGDTGGVVVQKDITSTSAATVVATGFSTSIKDILVDTDGTFYVADAGDGTINQVNLSAGTVTEAITGLNSPRDGVRSSSTTFLITEFGDNDVVSVSSTGTLTTVTTGLTLDGPDGIAK